MKNVILETARTMMKSPVGIIDSKDVISAINHRETLEYVRSAPCDYTEETANCFFGFLKRVEESNSMHELGLFDKSSDKFIGMMSLEDTEYMTGSRFILQGENQ